MRTIRTLALLFVAASSMSIAAQIVPAPATKVTVFEGARLIVGDGSAPIENAVFVVQGTQFTIVGRAGATKVPPAAEHVNLAGKTVMPAIIDTHTHMANERAALIEQLQKKAYYGTAVVMSLGQDAGNLAFEVRNETIPNAARIFTAGRGITMPEPGRTDIPYWVTTEAEARKAVQENAAKKVDIIKIWVDDRNGQYKKLTPELYRAIIDEAHKHGLRVTAHEYYLDDAKDLLRAGIDAFAHGVRDKDIDEEFVALMKKRNVVLVPNLPDRGVPTDMSWVSDTASPEELKKLQAAKPNPAAQAAFGIQARNLAKLTSAGVTIAFGTDGAVVWAPHVEMEDMVASGMTPQQVITAATKTSAEFMRLKDHGTVASGKVANFLVLDANPLDNITNTRKITAVYLRGTAVDRTGLRARWSKGTQ